MLVVIQRVSEAQLSIDGLIYSRINQGFVILLGIHESDDLSDVEYLAKKIIGLRIFADENDKMNLDISTVDGEILLVSQFTLFAQTKKGNRPSFIEAAKPEKAIPLYESMIQTLTDQLGKGIQTGKFGADMKVQLCNDGPVTIMIDSKNP